MGRRRKSSKWCATINRYGFQKNEIAVSRQLLAADPEHSFVSRYVLKQCDGCYKAHQWADLGYNATEELTRRISRCERIRELGITGVCIGADFKNFNSCHRLRDMANDYAIMYSMFPSKWRELGSSEEAVQDWMRCCKWLEDAALNCRMRLEDRKEEEQIRTALNERRHIVEATRAFLEWERCGVLQPRDRERVTIELGEDDSIMIYDSVVLSALHFTSFCASGRPMEGVKQEIWSNQCEYLRNKVTSHSNMGYLHRCLGTLISAPFGNTSKHDVVGRLHALNQQFATMVRRGALLRNTFRVFSTVMDYWSQYKDRRSIEEVAPRMSGLPNHIVYGDQRDDYRSRQCYGVVQPAPPRFQVKKTRVSEGIKARGASDLAQSMLSCGRPNRTRRSLEAEWAYKLNVPRWGGTPIWIRLDRYGSWVYKKVTTMWQAPEKIWRVFCELIDYSAVGQREEIHQIDGWYHIWDETCVTTSKENEANYVYGVVSPVELGVSTYTKGCWDQYVWIDGMSLGPVMVVDQINAIELNWPRCHSHSTRVQG
ncbi:hypothetical protein OSTOST_16481 [Ostertagia ostertagi]